MTGNMSSIQPIRSPYDVSRIPVVIFCGGRGTRLKEETEIVPKPLVPIGDKPILWHIMKIYYAHGFRRFVLLLGYKGEKIKEYVYGYQLHHSDFTIFPYGSGGSITYHQRPEETWEITCIDTGIDAQTGARLKRAEFLLKDGLFMLTYGDGVSDVDMQALLDVHAREKRIATVTGVHPPGRFGEIVVEGSCVKSFWEKPQVQVGYINGGFFAVEPSIFQFLSDDIQLNFEKDVLPELARKDQLAMHAHAGYWQCMDTIRDMELLNEEWQKPHVPWKLW